MAVLATPVYVDGTRYEAGTTPPALVGDKIRNGSAWVGGVAPALSTGAYVGKQKIQPEDLTSAVRLRAALGISDTATDAALATALAGKVGKGDNVISVRDYGVFGNGAAGGMETALLQQALSAATPGTTVVFPKPISYYKIDGPLIVPAGVTVEGGGRGCEIRQTVWAKPVFDLANVDGCTIRGFKMVYSGVRPTALTGVIFRGEDSYGYSSGVWSNGNNHLIENLYVVGFANAVRLVHWTTGNNYGGYRTGNRVLNVEAEGIDFGLLYQGQENLFIDDLYSHDHVDSSGGANPMHTIYGTGNNTLRSRNVIVGKAHGVNIPGMSSYAHQFKYVDGLTVSAATSDNCSGPWSSIDCNDVTVGVMAGKNCFGGLNEGAVLIQTINTNHQRMNVGIISLHMTVAEKALSLKADDSYIEHVAIYSDRNGVGTYAGYYDAVIVGNRTKIGNIRIRNRGTTQVKPILIGHPSHPTSDITISGLSCDNTLSLVEFSATATGSNVVEYNPADQRRIGNSTTYITQTGGSAANFAVVRAPHTRTVTVLAGAVAPVPTPALETVTRLEVQDGSAFTVGAPNILAPVGMVHEIIVANASGGTLGVISWNAAYSLRGAFYAPPANTSHFIRFSYDGTAWREISRSADARLGSDSPTVGEFVPDRDFIRDSNIAVASGTLYLSYWTADKSEPINTLTAFTGGTAAGATPTLCKMGIYSVAANGDIALVASTANDTALFAAANLSYPKATLSTFNKVAGTRYATGLIVVTGAATPTFHGLQYPATASTNTNVRVAPAIVGRVLSQTDLPASVGIASIVGIQSRIAMQLS